MNNFNLIICNRADKSPVVYLDREITSRLYELAVNYKILLNVIDTELLIYNTPELIVLRHKLLTQPRYPMITIKLAERLFKFRLLNVGKYIKIETPEKKKRKALLLLGYDFKETSEKLFTFSVYKTSGVHHAQNNTAEDERRNLERLTGYSFEEIEAHAHNNQQDDFKSYEYLLANGTLEIVKVIIE